MNSEHIEGPVYFCPMHPTVRQAHPAKCPKCGMALVPEGTRFAMIRHMMQRPLLLVLMVLMMVVMIVVMMATMRG